MLPQFIASLKSTNANVREGAQRAGIEILAKCTNQEISRAMVETLIKTLRTGKPRTQKQLKIERSVDINLAIARYIGAVSRMSTDVSTYVVQNLVPLFAKETNEAVISAMTETLLLHQRSLLMDNKAMDESTLRLIGNGLLDKRSKVKCNWAVAVSGMIWQADCNSFSTPALITFSKALGQNLINVFNDIASNAIQASQTGIIIGAYAISAAALGRWLDWQDERLGKARIELL